MKIRIMQSLLAATVVFGMCIQAHVANAQTSSAQTFSDWRPRPVPSAPEAKAKNSKPANVGRSSFKLRGVQPKANNQSQETIAGKCGGANSLAPDAPTVNSLEGQCCDCNRILLDGKMMYPNATLSLVNSTPNSTVPVTLGHGGPGRIGFSLNQEGPYTDTLVFNVNTNSSGNGVLLITFFIKGLDAGQSDMFTTVSSGFTNPVPVMEVFACQCPTVDP